MSLFQLPTTPQILLSQGTVSQKKPRQLSSSAGPIYLQSPEPTSPDLLEAPSSQQRASRFRPDPQLASVAQTIHAITTHSEDRKLETIHAITSHSQPRGADLFGPSQFDDEGCWFDKSLAPGAGFLPLTQHRDSLIKPVAAPFRLELNAPVAAAAAPGPIIVPYGGGGARMDGLYIHVQCAAYRAALSGSDCLYMTNITDPSAIAQMQRAFAATLYDFDHSVESRARVNSAAITLEPRWIDHAFWVARHFFTELRFTDAVERMELVRSFFIISLRLFFVEGGFSRRLVATPQFDAASDHIRTVERGRNSRTPYGEIGNLPTSMPPSTTFSLGADTKDWPEQVHIGDLWDHDICALFVLIPELVTAVVMEPDQHADTAEFRHLLYTHTYWPAFRVGDDVCVLVDECVRKIYKFQTLTFNSSTYSVDTLVTPYWPVVAARAQQQRKLVAARKQRAGGAAAVPAPTHPYAFNRCRRSNATAFWLTPFVKWNDTQTKTQFPKLLAQQIAQQTPHQRQELSSEIRPQHLAQMYPHLYMSPAHRAHTLARYSNTVLVDAVGEFMKHKSSIVNQHLRSVAAPSF